MASGKNLARLGNKEASLFIKGTATSLLGNLKTMLLLTKKALLSQPMPRVFKVTGASLGNCA